MKFRKVVSFICTVLILGGLSVLGFRGYYIYKNYANKKITTDIYDDIFFDDLVETGSTEENEENEEGVAESDNTEYYDTEGIEEGNESESSAVAHGEKTLGKKKKKSTWSGNSDLEKEKCKELIDSLREKYGNKDIIGYLTVDGHDVEYPILYGETNESYLKTSPSGGYDYNGSIFLDSGNRPTFVDSRSVIYGHNMRDGSMFGSLASIYSDGIKDETFTIYTYDGILTYDVLGTATVYAFNDNPLLNPVSLKIDEYANQGYSEAEIARFIEKDEGFYTGIDSIKSSCIYWNSDLDYSDKSHLVSLMTCYGDGKSHRFAVVGLLRE